MALQLPAAHCHRHQDADTPRILPEPRCAQAPAGHRKRSLDGATRLSRARPVWNLALGHSKHWTNSVEVADVEEHPLGGVAEYLARREIQHKESLTTFDLARIITLPLHSNHNRALMIP